MDAGPTKINSICTCCQSYAARVPSKVTGFCYAEPYTDLGLEMRPRNLVFITLLALCHLQLQGQTLTNALPPAAQVKTDQLPNDPGQEMIPLAEPEPAPATGVPVQFEALRQERAGDVLTLTGDVVVHYRDYVLSADKVVYHQDTSVLEADGHLQVAGGPNDVLINATHGEMRLSMHTARYYNVTGSEGVRKAGRTIVYSTTNPFMFAGRVLLQFGEGNYKIVDGSMTNCRLPKPDWRLISRTINLENGKASTTNSFFELLGFPVFYLPYLSHPVDDAGRDSGVLIPVLSNSSIKGFIVGEQLYWAINRSMDMVIGSEYYSKRGWAPNGDFRYKGHGLDHLTARFNALLDRGVEEEVGATIPAAAVRTSGQPAAQPTDHLPGPVGEEKFNQGGVDIVALGRKDLSPNMHAAGTVEYLSSYLYRLVFNDNYSQAISSEVASDLTITHAHNGFVPSVELDRFETFASSASGNEAKILHLPEVHYDILDKPLGESQVYWGLSTSVALLNRSEPHLHSQNAGRTDVYPHISVPFHLDGWSVIPEAAVRDTFYTISQVPDLTGKRSGTPSIDHAPLNRADFEASVDLRPPAFERDFTINRWNRVLRHVVEPELTYKYVAGIGSQAQNVLLIDTADIATNTNQVGYSLTQRFYLRPIHQKPCDSEAKQANGDCPAPMREWATWQIAQEFFIDPSFGGAIIPNRRNVFDSTLDLSGVAFLTGSRDLSPITSRIRFEAIDNLRVEWDLDYDPRVGQLDSDNLFAGYTKGITTVGLGHALLNAVDENGSSASTIKSQQLQPFVTIGKQSRAGFNFAANAGYDFVLGQLQYGGLQANYNWDCCGLTFGYRRFQLGSVRDETQWLYSFTLASFGSVGDIRRSNSVFRDPTLPPVF
jgi:LPS-assembly protein